MPELGNECALYCCIPYPERAVDLVRRLDLRSVHSHAYAMSSSELSPSIAASPPIHLRARSNAVQLLVHRRRLEEVGRCDPRVNPKITLDCAAPQEALETFGSARIDAHKPIVRRAVNDFHR